MCHSRLGHLCGKNSVRPEYVLRRTGRVLEREHPGRMVAGLKELWEGMLEEEEGGAPGGVEQVLGGMRVRLYMEHQLQASASKRGKKRNTNSVTSSASPSSTTPSSSKSPSLLSSATEAARPSTSTSSHTVVSGSSHGHQGMVRMSEEAKGRKRSGSTHGHDMRSGVGDSEGEKEIANWMDSGDKERDDADDAEFERLMMSGKTMKVSLTPNRLRTMEAFEKEKAHSRNASSSGASTPSAKMSRERSLSQPQPNSVTPKISPMMHTMPLSSAVGASPSSSPSASKPRLKPRGARFRR
ncbi:hypothetical protein BT69DRAFT_1107786 [Atractiella rhizophila]|nr:hypothetical protein BT69DRAFT_1107786 [Atractiella rhizophila]